MSLGSTTAKELAKLGVNLEIRDGLGSTTIKELVRIVKSQGRHISVSSRCIGSTTAKEIAKIGGENLTIIIENKD
ncbi:MAG: hypothetical protein K8R39_03750 [Arcobacteraceae bacterium]|nr:hypothetical protein [Arcobacteraceae bacterium]